MDPERRKGVGEERVGDEKICLDVVVVGYATKPAGLFGVTFGFLYGCCDMVVAQGWRLCGACRRYTVYRNIKIF